MLQVRSADYRVSNRVSVIEHRCEHRTQCLAPRRCHPHGHSSGASGRVFLPCRVTSKCCRRNVHPRIPGVTKCKREWTLTVSVVNSEAQLTAALAVICSAKHRRLGSDTDRQCFDGWPPTMPARYPQSRVSRALQQRAVGTLCVKAHSNDGALNRHPYDLAKRLVVVTADQVQWCTAQWVASNRSSTAPAWRRFGRGLQLQLHQSRQVRCRTIFSQPRFNTFRRPHAKSHTKRQFSFIFIFRWRQPRLR